MRKFAMGEVALSVPEGYELSMAVVAAGPENKFCRNLVIAKERVAPDVTLDAYKDSQLKMLEIFNMSTVKTSTVEIGGKPCPLIETESAGPSGLQLRSLVAYVRRGDVVFILTATDLKDADGREDLLAMMKSFDPGKSSVEAK